MAIEQIPFWQRLTCSIQEACEVTSLGRSSIYGMIGRGELETRKVGRRQLIVIRSLEALVKPPS